MEEKTPLPGIGVPVKEEAPATTQSLSIKETGGARERIGEEISETLKFIPSVVLSIF